MTDVFHLPYRTVVGKIIPKNAFDISITLQQKKHFTESIERMRWSNKISFETTNLIGNEIQEIQVISIELRKKEGVDNILKTINELMPYHLICYVTYKNQFLISVCLKHASHIDKDRSVIEWMLNSRWLEASEQTFSISLKNNLDLVYLDICQQISGLKETNLSRLFSLDKKRSELLKSIKRLENQIMSCKQFNRKVELNIELRKQKAVYDSLFQ